jgi:hypothetical protein
MRLRGTVTDSARVIAVEGTSGTANAYIQGDGLIVSSARGYFETGVRFSTSSGTLNDFGIYVGSGTPEGVVAADPGSLYLNKSGGAGTSLYVKQSGSGNTGWAGK